MDTTTKGVDALEQLTYLIAECFVEEVEERLPDLMIEELKVCKDNIPPLTKPKVRTAGGGNG